MELPRDLMTDDLHPGFSKVILPLLGLGLGGAGVHVVWQG